MACRRIGGKPLHEVMMTLVADAYMYSQASFWKSKNAYILFVLLHEMTHTQCSYIVGSNSKILIYLLYIITVVYDNVFPSDKMHLYIHEPCYSLLL